MNGQIKRCTGEVWKGPGLSPEAGVTPLQHVDVFTKQEALWSLEFREFCRGFVSREQRVLNSSSSPSQPPPT